MSFLNKSIKLIDQTSFSSHSILKEELQNLEYEGLLIESNQEILRSRLAKKTPKKKGYFVAFWEKDSNNKNQAYHVDDEPHHYLILVDDEGQRGMFVFPVQVLEKQGILRNETQKGKMAIRVYPSWESDLNPTATKTQKWQNDYFYDLN